MEKYPLISEYIEAIKAAEENFEQLKHLRPVLDEDTTPVMSGGNFAVVFKMIDDQTGKYHAVKCFLREQEGRAEAYRMIAKELESVNSPFLIPIRYLDKELFVYTGQTSEREFPVLLMDWVEGMTLDKYVRRHINDDFKLLYLSYQFSQLAVWLIPQPFAHGDLKPDNILIREDGNIVLVDYDGMYVPAMKGQRARELGSPDFRHPNRTETDFDEHIDDFSLISILVSLKAIAMQPRLLEEYGASDRLLFSQDDYRDLSKCRLLKELYPSDDPELNVLLSIYTIAQTKGNLVNVSSHLLDLPKTSDILDEIAEAWFREMEEERAPYEIADSWSLKDFIKENTIISFQLGGAFYSVTEGGEDAVFFRNKVGKELIAFNQCGLTKENIVTQKDDITIELRKSGHYIICGYSTKVSDNNLHNAITDEFGIMYSENKKRLLGLSASYLPNYEIPEGVEIICDDAFNSVWRKEDPEFLPYWRKADELSIGGTIIIPSSVRYIGRNPFRGDYKSITCNSPYFLIEDDALYTADKKRLISCFSKQLVFNVPEGVEQIGSFAFRGCVVESIIIPESVSYIGDNPFIEMEITDNSSLEVICNSHKFFVKGNAIYQKNPQKLLSYWGKSQLIYIEDGTISINPYSLCTGISRIYLPDSIQGISEDAFNEDGTKLKQVLIPINSIEKFTQLFPRYEKEFVEVDLSNEWVDEFGVKYSVDLKKLIKVPQDIVSYSVINGTEEIGDYSFACCNALNHIDIPNTVTQIGVCAFRDCVSLEEIVLPDSIITIKNSAFSECKSLKRIYIPNSLKDFEGSKFLGCTNLSQIIIPNGTKEKFDVLLSGYEDDIVEEQDVEMYSEEYTTAEMESAWTDEYGAKYSPDGKRLFKGPSLSCSTYTIKEGTMVVCSSAFFWNKELTVIHMPNSVIQIGEWAFHSCINLHDIIISNNVKRIKDSTFKYCRSLSKVILPHSVTRIDDDAFCECSNLTDISIPDSVLEVGYQAFSGCNSLHQIVVPESVKRIGTYAFAGCSLLNSISILGAPKIGDAIFHACVNLKSIYIPSWKKRSVESYLGEYYHLLDRTRDYPFTNSWSLKEFISLHGKLRIEETIDDQTGEVFNLCVFTNLNGEETYARDYYYWGGSDIAKITGDVETFRIGEDTYGGYNLYDKTLDYWESGMIMEWQYD